MRTELGKGNPAGATKPNFFQIFRKICLIGHQSLNSAWANFHKARLYYNQEAKPLLQQYCFQHCWIINNIADNIVNSAILLKTEEQQFSEHSLLFSNLILQIQVSQTRVDGVRGIG